MIAPLSLVESIEPYRHAVPRRPLLARVLEECEATYLSYFEQQAQPYSSAPQCFPQTNPTHLRAIAPSESKSGVEWCLGLADRRDAGSGPLADETALKPDRRALHWLQRRHAWLERDEDASCALSLTSRCRRLSEVYYEPDTEGKADQEAPPVRRPPCCYPGSFARE